MKKIFALIIMILVCISSVAYATEMKTYRNRDWQFRIDVPASYEYYPSTGNIVMTAKGGNSAMNVVVQEAPYLKNASMENLALIAKLQMDMPEFSNAIVDSGYTYINNLPAYWGIYKRRYKRQTREYSLTMITFQFITNYKYYSITYAASPELYEQEKPIFMQSINSFVDETGFD